MDAIYMLYNFSLNVKPGQMIWPDQAFIAQVSAKVCTPYRASDLKKGNCKSNQGEQCN